MISYHKSRKSKTKPMFTHWHSHKEQENIWLKPHPTNPKTEIKVRAGNADNALEHICIFPVEQVGHELHKDGHGDAVSLYCVKTRPKSRGNKSKWVTFVVQFWCVNIGDAITIKNKLIRWISKSSLKLALWELSWIQLTVWLHSPKILRPVLKSVTRGTHLSLYTVYGVNEFITLEIH